jgi:hypothetical protein
LGLAVSCEKASGFETDFINMPTSNGKAPIVFEAINTTATIIEYLRKLFWPLKEDSR